MSEEKKPRKPFNETGLGRFLKEKVKPVLGDVVSIAGDVTGIEALERVGDLLNAKRDEDAAIAALASEFEMKRLEWQMEMEKLELQSEMEALRLEVQDRESARNREVEFMRSSGGKRDWLMGAVIITGLAMMLAVISALVFIDIPQDNKELAYMAFGAVMTVGTQIFAYYVGSSRGSRMKDEVLRKR